MKRKILFGITIFCLVFVLFLNVLNAGPGEPEADGGADHYDRYDTRCPDGVTEKTNCLAGGNELCTPQYCN